MLPVIPDRFLMMSVLMFLILLGCSSCEEFSNLSRLVTREEIKDYLTDPSRYNAHFLPDFNSDNATNVRVQITVHDMHSISETGMDYSLDIFFRQRWRDQRLDFTQNETKFDKLEIDPKNIGSVWRPDTYFRNERKASVHTVTTVNELMHIHKNGTVLYSMRLAMTLKCTMLLHKYPFDKQTCPLFVQSFGYTVDNIDLSWMDVRPLTINEMELPQFVLDSDGTYTKFMLEHLTGRFTCLKAEIVIKRKMQFFFLNVFVPSTLLVVLSWVAFWVDPVAVPARVTLGVTCVLTMTTQSAGVRQTLPPVSYIKAIDIWMFVCLIYVFAALLEFAYVNVLHRRQENKAKGKADAVEEGNLELDETTSGDKKEPDNKWYKKMKLPFFKDRKKMGAHAKAKHVDIMSRILFPVTFVLFMTVFFMVCALAPNPFSNTVATSA